MLLDNKNTRIILFFIYRKVYGKMINFLAMKKREILQTTKKSLNTRFIKTLKHFEIFPCIILFNGGEGGIRTHGPFRNHWFSRPAP